MRLLLLLPRPVLLLSVTLIAGLCTFTLLIGGLQARVLFAFLTAGAELYD